MDIRNCRSCKKLYNYTGNSRYCPACAEELEKKFQEVKQYVYEHPGVGIGGVAEDMDVEIFQIKQWIRDERLVLTNASESEIVCDSCGICIVTGKYCDACKAVMSNQLSSSIEKKQKENKVKESIGSARGKERMRFFDSK